jgi:hypothetical protein
MTTKPTASKTPAAKAKDEEKGKVVTPTRVAVGAAIGSAAIAAAVLFAGRIGKPTACAAPPPGRIASNPKDRFRSARA